MNQYVTFSDSLVITLFSMIIVFVGLMIISVLISGLKYLNRQEEEQEIEKLEEIKKTVVDKGVEDYIDMEDQEELVAVIAAAISASMGIPVENFNIRNIKRADTKDPWSQMAIREGLSNKL